MPSRKTEYIKNTSTTKTTSIEIARKCMHKQKYTLGNFKKKQEKTIILFRVTTDISFHTAIQDIKINQKVHFILIFGRNVLLS